MDVFSFECDEAPAIDVFWFCKNGGGERKKRVRKERGGKKWKKTQKTQRLGKKTHPPQTGQRQTPNPLQHSHERVLLATREAAAAAIAAAIVARKRSCLFCFRWGRG